MSPTGPLRLDLPPVTDSVPRARTAVGERLASWAVHPDDAAALELAVTEAVANAVEHAPEGDVTVTVTTDGEVVRACVTDRGTWKGAASRSSDRGRGLVLLADVVDELHIVRAPEGTSVRFARRCATR